MSEITTLLRLHCHDTQTHVNRQTSLSALFPLVNRKNHLKQNYDVLLCKSILSPLQPQPKKIHHVFQNNSLARCDRPWFVRNNQLLYDLQVDKISEVIVKKYKRYH